MTKSDRDIGILFDTASEELDSKQALLEKKYRLGHLSDWKADLAVPEISFRDKGKLVVSASLIVVGSFGDGIWKWGWATESLPGHVRNASLPMQEFHEKTGLQIFTDEAWRGVEEQAWLITALACRRFKAEGAYRLPSGRGAHVYTVLTNLRGA